MKDFSCAVGRRLLWLWDHSIGFVFQVVFLALIKGYQLTISRLLPPSCRFHPSCSAYAFGSVRVHGSAKGLALATVRLLRCNPWNKGGVNPVPAKGRWVSDVYPDGRARITPDGEHVHS
jgi:putative membrane protein insertion efficiency factor